MRAPPPAEYTSALGRAWRAALSLLVAASVAVPLAWGLPHVAAHWGNLHPDPLVSALAEPAVQAGLAGWCAAMVLAALWLWRQGSNASERTLRWDGHEWVLPGLAGAPEQRGRAALMLDLGPWMLVRFVPHAGTAAFGMSTWLPFTLAGDLARWSALRAALWTCPGATGRSTR
jgi:hypothetical protein